MSIEQNLCVKTICSPSAILCGTEPVSALTRALYIAALSMIFYFLELSVAIAR